MKAIYSYRSTLHGMICQPSARLLQTLADRIRGLFFPPVFWRGSGKDRRTFASSAPTSPPHSDRPQQAFVDPKSRAAQDVHPRVDDRDRRTSVLLFGRVPPPVTGMNLLTRAVLDALQSAGPVEFVNSSVGATRGTPIIRLRYALRTIGLALRLLTSGRARGRRLYLVANSQAGLYFTLLLVTVARRMGYSIYLHHHVYSYINHYDRRMAWITRSMGSAGVHVVHCEKMARDFRARYDSAENFAIVYPSAVSIPLQSSRESARTPIRLGMLSNLMISKGVGRAIETFRVLYGRGRSVALILAGPLLESEATQLVERAVKEFPGLVEYRGPVFGEDKARYFSEIDVFLFPTQYEHESWGIVLNESLAAGVPVIANDRGCSRVVFGEQAGLLVQNSADFVSAAASQIEHWLDTPSEYAAASKAAIEQAEHLNRAGERTLADFSAHMFSPSGSTAGLLKSL